MFGSSRSGGIRGGQDQFNWDEVKVDKHRENYLGKSITCSRLRYQRVPHIQERLAPDAFKPRVAPLKLGCFPTFCY